MGGGIKLEPLGARLLCKAPPSPAGYTSCLCRNTADVTKMASTGRAHKFSSLNIIMTNRRVLWKRKVSPEALTLRVIKIRSLFGPSHWYPQEGPRGLGPSETKVTLDLSATFSYCQYLPDTSQSKSPEPSDRRSPHSGSQFFSENFNSINSQ